MFVAPAESNECHPSHGSGSVLSPPPPKKKNNNIYYYWREWLCFPVTSYGLFMSPGGVTGKNLTTKISPKKLNLHVKQDCP